MKLLFQILGCFLLYMSCIPCGDSKDCNLLSRTAISSANDQQQHNHDKESCTPFCTCSCCAAHVLFTPFSKAAIHPAYFHAVTYSRYKVPFIADVDAAIWQPPQIS